MRRPPQRFPWTAITAGVLLGLLAGVLGCDALPWAPRDDVLVLARRGDATSHAIATEYASRRNLADGRVLELTLTIAPGTRVIPADDYHREIAASVERHLRLTDPARRVRMIVTTRGLPLLVEECDPSPCRRASLDAALAQLGRTSGGRAFEIVPNPSFGHASGATDAPTGALRFLVARLTAPLGADDARGSTPRVLAEALSRAEGIGSPEAGADAQPAAPEWLVATSGPRAPRATALGLLLDPLGDQLAHWGHGVCDGCARGAETGASFAGLVLGGNAPAPAVRLHAPGLVVTMAPTRLEADRRRREAVFDDVVTRWLARGATAIGIHLGDPDLAAVARPAPILLAAASGRTVVEAWFAGLPLLGGAHVLVGDPLVAAPVPARLEALLADADGDGIADPEDNCPHQPNRDQRDTNGDGFGNRCDPDLDGDGLVDSSAGRIYPLEERGDLETIALTARQGAYHPDHDLDGDGAVDERDLTIVRLGLHRPPGG